MRSTPETKVSLTLGLLSGLLCTCGTLDPPPTSDYLLRANSPLPERVRSGDRIRTLVVGREARVGPDRRAEQCTLTAMLFDATTNSSTVPAQNDSESECRFYATRYENDFVRQRWVCAGALGLSATGLSENFGYCPSDPMTAPAYRFTLRACGGITANGLAHLASMDEGIPGDVLTDLNSDLTLPAAVVIQGPSELSTLTWPESGDLTLRWTSAGATSALVRLEPVDPSAMSVIVCNVRRNGTQRVPADMISQAMLRAVDTRVSVMSFRENNVTAENGRAYVLAGMTSSNVLLQGRR